MKATRTRLAAAALALITIGSSARVIAWGAQGHRLVKRPGDRDWVSLATPEGEHIVSEWTTWGGDGAAPVV